MLEISMQITIESLWKRGKSKSEISAMTGHDWKTVSKVIETKKRTGDYPSPKIRLKILDNYRAQISEFIEHNLTGRKIFEKLKLLGVDVSYSTVKNYIVNIKKVRDSEINSIRKLRR